MFEGWVVFFFCFYVREKKKKKKDLGESRWGLWGREQNSLTVGAVDLPVRAGDTPLMPHLPDRHVIPDARVELVFDQRVAGMPSPAEAGDGDRRATWRPRGERGGVVCETGKRTHDENKYSESG